MAILPSKKTPTDLLPPLDRRAQREIQDAESAGAALTARERAKIDAAADVTTSALMAAAHVSAMEALLIQRTPHAEERLKYIADVGTAGIAGVVVNLSQRCR